MNALHAQLSSLPKAAGPVPLGPRLSIPRTDQLMARLMPASLRLDDATV